MNYKPGKTAGFLLMEVMVATAILGIGLVVIIQSLNASLKNSAAAENVATASWLLQQKLADVFQYRYVTGRDRGDFGQAWSNFTWETDCRRLSQNLDDVTMTVYWQERNEAKKVSAETFISKP
jgi:type II secretory pathway pseudopilin PulG